MGLSRKRERELKRLKRTTSELWDEQREVLEHANQVVREASRQLANVGREELAPRVKGAYETHVKPGVESGLAAGKHIAGTAKDKLSRDVLPAVSSTLGSALAVFETIRDPRVREVVQKVRDAGSKAKIVPAKQSAGPGRYILIAVGVVAVAGVAYAAWQTLRADDELWVSDEPDEGTGELVDAL